MLFGVGVSCRILWSVVCCLYASCGGLIASGRGGGGGLSAVVCLWLCAFCSWGSSSLCLGCAALFSCGTPWAFHIIFFILLTVPRTVLLMWFSMLLVLVLVFVLFVPSVCLDDI